MSTTLVVPRQPGNGQAPSPPCGAVMTCVSAETSPAVYIRIAIAIPTGLISFDVSVLPGIRTAVSTCVRGGFGSLGYTSSLVIFFMRCGRSHNWAAGSGASGLDRGGID